MKIVCISPSQVPSDTANSIQVMKVCQAFTQLDHHVILLVPGPKPEGAEPENLLCHYGLKNIFEIEWLPGRSRRFFPWKATWRGQQLGADLLYCWPLQSAALGVLLGIPSLVELHDFPSGRFGALWLKLLMILPGKKRLLPISDALRRLLQLPEKYSLVAPDGVDIERYSSLPDPESARRQMNLPLKQTVLCTGHLYPGRGVDIFLTLAGRFPSVSFVWVGGRPVDVEKWKSRANGLRLENVTFTGFVANELIPLYQASADVLLMPYEQVVTTSSGGNTAQVCSPMKMFEYMASGRAILSSNLPVLREVLDESMAVFCQPGDEAAWESAVLHLLDHPEERKVLAQHSRQAAQRYSWLERSKLVLQGFL